MADGEVSFSGPMGGYGWLVIIDHPWANIYSLYGHLSPSRWHIEEGQIDKGDLIGYLGDGWENGGSIDEPLQAHLHLGVRAGQRTDYPGRGDWRWMAGWINSCPSDIGWFPPSEIITAQTVPEGGFAMPDGNLIERWGVELLILAGIGGGIAWWIAVGLYRRNWIIPIVSSTLALVGAVYFTMRGFNLVPYGLYVAVGVGVVGSTTVALRQRYSRP